MSRVVVRTICRPTENLDMVMRSMLNIFPDLQIEVADEELVGTSGSVDNLEELLRKQKIRSAARTVFRRSVEGAFVKFSLYVVSISEDIKSSLVPTAIRSFNCPSLKISLIRDITRAYEYAYPDTLILSLSILEYV